MGERRYLIATGVTAGLELAESRRLVRASVESMVSLFTGLFGYERLDALGLDPTVQQMREELRRFCLDRDPDDLVVLYHVGHASVELEEHRLWMGGATDRHSDTLRTADLPALILDGTPVRQVLIIIESCHAGRGAAEALMMGMRLVRRREPKSLATITAAHPGEQVRPGDFVRLFDEAVRQPRPGGGELTLGLIAERIMGNPRRPEWQTVSACDLFRTEEGQRFFSDLAAEAPCGTGFDLLTRAEEDDLFDLLLALPTLPRPAELVGVVQSASGFLGLVPIAANAELFQLVQRLAAAFSPIGRLPPLLAFLEFFAVRLAAPHRRRMHAFVREAANRLAVPDGQLAELTAAAALSGAAELTPACLLVTVERDCRPDHYLLSSCLYLSPESLPDKRQQPQPCHRDQLQECVEGLLDQAVRWLGDTDPGLLTVEFLLPLELLDQPVDHWRIGAGTLAAAGIGLQCVVVVRSLDRARHGWTRALLHRRWARLHASRGHAQENRVCWLHRSGGQPTGPADMAIDGMDRDTLHARILSWPALVCLGLAFAYLPGRQAEVDGLAVALAAGVPAALWRRDGGDVSPLRDRLAALVSSGALARLPHEVHDLRLSAAAAGVPGHVGSHLTLLWDDPRRQPDDEMYAPSLTPRSGQ